MTITELNLIRCLSPLHVGSGSAIGIVDLPVQRESYTNFPKIESSSLKGAYRYNAHQNHTDREQYLKVFGNEPDDDSLTQAGSLSLSESRILAFPVKSLNKVFTLITCPMVLNRFKQEQAAFLDNEQLKIVIPELENDDSALVSNQSVLIKNKVVLEEYVLSGAENESVKKIANNLDKILGLNGYLSERFVVVSDNIFNQFVEYSTEINTRIRIDYKTGTVAEGALFYEENVPAETIFYNFISYHKPKKEAEGKLEIKLTETGVKDFIEENVDKVLQVGGNATIGQGMIQRVPVLSKEEV